MFLATVANSFWIAPDDWLGLTGRLTLATLVGGVIGWNRQMSGKAAGLRTHMLVSLGAALFVIVLLAVSTPAEVADNPLSRAIQGVATGVGFLGAGEIFHQSRSDVAKPKVRGLTSAAAIWLSAGLGVAAACGFWQICIIATLLSLLVLTEAKLLEQFARPAQRDRDK